MRSVGHAGGGDGSSDRGQAQEQKRDPGRGPGRLEIIGLGPGRLEGLSFQAKKALDEAEAILGYKAYIDQIEELVQGKVVFRSGMTKELERAGKALEMARDGLRVAMVSGGDPGIYAMAGVVFELARAGNVPLGEGPGQIPVRVIPGIPALAAAAARLGAPLTHDFAVISLSDRLTPWELIEKRLAAAAGADFVIVLYNPKSKGRDWQFARAVDIVAQSRRPDTPVGVVTGAMRDGETVRLTTLKDASTATVDMRTLVIIGNSRTFVYLDRMVTPRGYLDKYSVQG